MIVFPFRLQLGVVLLVLSGVVWAETPTMEVILSTPVSSRVNKAGNKIQAVLREPVSVNGKFFPSGTMVNGVVDQVASSQITHREGRIRLVFTEQIFPTGEVDTLTLIPDTEDGWLYKIDGSIPACKIMPGHSTRLLNMMIRRRLPSDRAIWNQALGINSNDIPDPMTDAFMESYNRHDVLLGAGDWVRLRVCPYPQKYLAK